MSSKKMAERFFVIMGIVLILGSCQRQEQGYPLVQAPTTDSKFFEAGLAAVEQKVRNNPGNPDAYFKRAIYLEAVGNSQGALSSIKQAISLDPTPEYLIKEAELLMIMGSYSQALNSVSRAQILGGDYPRLWHLMSQLNYQEGAYRLALSQVDKALLKNPQGVNYFYTKGMIQWALSDTLGSRASLIKAVEHPEVRYLALKQLVAISKAMGDYDSAFEYLAQNRQQQKGDQSLMFELGQLLRESAQYDSALAVFHHLIRQDSTDYRPLYESSLVHFENRRYDSALIYSDKVLAISSDFLPAMLTQARVYDRRSYYSVALKTYQNILDRDSTYLPAVQELEKLNGKVAYLQRIERNRRRNAGLKKLAPSKPKNENN